MKDILIETSLVSLNDTGIGVYVKTFLKSFAQKGIDVKMSSFSYPKPLFRLKFILYILYLNTIFYIKTLFLKPTTIIFPCFLMPYFTHKKHSYCPVIHDLTAYRPGDMSLHGGTIQKLAINIAVRKATKIITVSQTIKEELLNRFRFNPDNIIVVNNAIGDNFILNSDNNIDVFEKYKITSPKYILCVSSFNKRKNVESLIKAYEKISGKYSDIKLAIAAGKEPKEKYTNDENILFLGYIDTEDMPALYKNALFYVFPTKYEGFGTPTIEAQFSGVALLCSDIPVLVEVAGKGAEFCEPESDKIAEKIEYLINNPERREELVKLGKENVKRFDIKNITEQLMEVVKD